MHIGEFIKWRRKILGYTQQQLADFLSISKQAVNKWEKCLTTPDIMVLPELGAVLKKSPHFLTNIIWYGNHVGELIHFIFLLVTEKDGESYIINCFEHKDFPLAADFYDEIRKGYNEFVLQKLVEFYSYDSLRTFQINLEQYENSALEDCDTGGLLIDSCDITSIVVNYYNQSKTNK